MNLDIYRERETAFVFVVLFMAFSPSPIFMEEWFDEKVGVYVFFFGLVLYRWTCNGEQNDLIYIQCLGCWQLGSAWAFACIDWHLVDWCAYDVSLLLRLWEISRYFICFCI
jgi:hypothetical protein